MEDGHTLFDYDVGLNDLIQILVRKKTTDVQNSESAAISSKDSSGSEQTSNDEDLGNVANKENEAVSSVFQF